jgi:hypothetical protein
VVLAVSLKPRNDGAPDAFDVDDDNGLSAEQIGYASAGC